MSSVAMVDQLQGEGTKLESGSSVKCRFASLGSKMCGHISSLIV